MDVWLLDHGRLMLWTLVQHVLVPVTCTGMIVLHWVHHRSIVWSSFKDLLWLVDMRDLLEMDPKKESMMDPNFSTSVGVLSN